MAATRVVGGLAGLALAFGLGACGGDGGADGSGASTTSTQPGRARTTPARPKRSGPPTVPARLAGDVGAVRKALEAAGFTVESSRGAGRSLAQLQAGETLVSFYDSAGDAAAEATRFKKVLASGPGRGAVRASGARLYISSKKADARFSKIVSTAESALR